MNHINFLSQGQGYLLWNEVKDKVQVLHKLLALLLCLLLLLYVEGNAQSKTLLNLNRKGVILKGYDPVAFYTENKPVQGSPAFQIKYKGAIYYFESAANKNIFEQNPEHYIPQFGGFCAYAVSLGKTADIDVQTFSIVQGRLLLQYDQEVFEKWKKDVEGNLKKADKNWLQLVAEEGQ